MKWLLEDGDLVLVYCNSCLLLSFYYVPGILLSVGLCIQVSQPPWGGYILSSPSYWERRRGVGLLYCSFQGNIHIVLDAVVPRAVWQLCRAQRASVMCWGKQREVPELCHLLCLCVFPEPASEQASGLVCLKVWVGSGLSEEHGALESQDLGFSLGPTSYWLYCLYTSWASTSLSVKWGSIYITWIQGLGPRKPPVNVFPFPKSESLWA